MPTDITPIGPLDLANGASVGEALLALNNAYEVELSRLDIERLRMLVTQSFYCGRVGWNEALLIAFDQSSAYDGYNFKWFRDRLQRFIYIDRVVVGGAFRGKGHAQRLYLDLFERAREAGHDRVVCEVNSSPPNPKSDRFHAGFGFEEVGSSELPGGQKTVRYLMLRLDEARG